jgi:hypothetical protein
MLANLKEFLNWRMNLDSCFPDRFHNMSNQLLDNQLAFMDTHSSSQCLAVNVLLFRK